VARQGAGRPGIRGNSIIEGHIFSISDSFIISVFRTGGAERVSAATALALLSGMFSSELSAGNNRYNAIKQTNIAAILPIIAPFSRVERLSLHLRWGSVLLIAKASKKVLPRQSVEINGLPVV